MYSEHFSVTELQCPTAKIIRLAPGFLDNLEGLRGLFDYGMSVSSGCRTEDHNNWLLIRGYKASKASFHLTDNPKYPTNGCCAIDIAWPPVKHKHRFIKIATAEGWSVGIAKKFIHLDRRVDYTNLPAAFYTY